VTGALDQVPRAQLSAAMQRAAAFIEAAAEPLATACAHALIGREPASAVFARMRDRGPAPSLRGSLQVLGILDDLRCLDATPAQRACEQLSAAQQRDGSWSERAETCEDKRIVVTADDERIVVTANDERIVVTGMAAGYLAKTPFVRRSVLAAAADYLAARWQPERVKGDDWEMNAAYFHCFALVLHEQADAILQWCGRELDRGLRTGAYDAVQTARVFVLCRARALPGARLTASELVARILDEQRDDGGFAAESDTARVRVARTRDALVALDRLA